MNGTITTVAGNGIAGFSGDGGQATMAELNVPQGIAPDSQGNLYIADYGNSRVRKVVLATGVITTVAGAGKYQFSGDGAAATAAGLDPYDLASDSAGNLYIADTLNRSRPDLRLRRFKAPVSAHRRCVLCRWGLSRR